MGGGVVSEWNCGWNLKVKLRWKYLFMSLKRRKTSLKSCYFVDFSPSSKEREPTFRCTFVHQEWDLNKSVKEDHEVMLLSSRSYIQCLCAFGHAVGHPGRSHQIVLYHHCRRSSLGSRYLSPSFPLPHIGFLSVSHIIPTVLQMWRSGIGLAIYSQSA